MNCKNHPGKPARRSCFHCRKPICPACQLKAHHHIFCGEACAETSVKEETGEFPQQLERLDASINEDLREYGDEIVENFRSEFSRLEAELDHALTALATMIEGSAVAAAEDSSRTHRESLQTIERSDRRAEERHSDLADRQSTMTQSVMALRETIHTLQERMNDFRATFQKRTEAVESEIARLRESGERNSTKELSAIESLRSEELPRLMEEERIVLEKGLRGHLEVLDRQEKTLAAFRTEDLPSFLSAQKRMQEDWAERISAELSKTLTDRTQRLLDDIATLNVAQRGNWNDVLSRAQKGAEQAALELRTDLGRKLDGEVKLLAGKQSDVMSKAMSDVEHVLRRRIDRPAALPWKISVAAIGAVLALILGGGAWYLQRLEHKFGTLEARVGSERNHSESLLQKLEDLLRQRTSERPTASIPRVVPLNPAVTRGSLHRKEVAFTFDGGGRNADAAPEILDTLKANSARATIFVTGKFIQEHPELIRRMTEEGHELANHLLDHFHLVDGERAPTLSKEDLVSQLHEVERRYETLTGQPMLHYWRAPYGEVSREILNWAASMGYTHVGWTRSGRQSLDTLDWVTDRKSSLYRTADAIEKRVIDFGKGDPNGLNGGVILMHLGTERQSDFPHKKLPSLLAKLRNDGYRLVTISELFRTETASKSN